MSAISRAVTAIILVSIVGACIPAAATTFAKGLGDATGPLVAVGIAATYFGSGDDAKPTAARVADSAFIAWATAQLLKPNLRIGHGDDLHGFPSGHSAIAFATATSLAEAEPKHKWLYYAGAALIGWSRVEANAHTWGDVAAGAALGFGVGKWSMSSEDGLMLGRVYRF